MDKELEELKLKYNEIRSNNTTRSVLLDEQTFLVEAFISSMNLETNSNLSKTQIQNLIETNQIDPTKDKKIQLEILNYKKAFHFICTLVNKRKKLTEDDLKEAYEILNKDLNDSKNYRHVNVSITNSVHQPPDYIKVYDRMRKLFFDLDYFRGNQIEKAAFAHCVISKIHPFLHYNQKMARLIMNYFLLFDGYIPLYIPVNEKVIYFNAIDIYKEDRDLSVFINYLIKLLKERYSSYIENKVN